MMRGAILLDAELGLVATSGGPTILARIGVMKALHRRETAEQAAQS
jgi:predicted acylesterase/phospholipase RssA